MGNTWTQSWAEVHQSVPNLWNGCSIRNASHTANGIFLYPNIPTAPHQCWHANICCHRLTISSSTSFTPRLGWRHDLTSYFTATPHSFCSLPTCSSQFLRSLFIRAKPVWFPPMSFQTISCLGFLLLPLGYPFFLISAFSLLTATFASPVSVWRSGLLPFWSFFELGWCHENSLMKLGHLKRKFSGLKTGKRPDQPWIFVF